MSSNKIKRAYICDRLHMSAVEIDPRIVTMRTPCPGCLEIGLNNIANLHSLVPIHQSVTVTHEFRKPNAEDYVKITENCNDEFKLQLGLHIKGGGPILFKKGGFNG